MKNSIRKKFLWVSKRPLLIILIFFLIFPFIMPYKALATEILIWGLFSLGFNIVYGYTGLLHFGAAAYFGIGAYGMGILLSRYDVFIWFALLFSVTMAGLGAAIIGSFCLRRRGVYFALLNLAFAQVLYFIAFQWVSLTGGEVGLRGISVPSISFPGFSVNIDSSLKFYYFTLFFVMITVLVLRRVLNSPFGKVLESIRENEKRARACGYHTERIKLLSFIMAGVVSGLAGALYALYMQFVGTEYLHYVTSGTVIMMSLLGGAGTFLGPFIGAGFYLFLEDVISVYTNHWSIFVGAVFCACVLLFPEGICGRMKMLIDRLKES